MTITPADLKVGDLCEWPDGRRALIVLTDGEQLVFRSRKGDIRTCYAGQIATAINRDGAKYTPAVPPVPHPAALADLYEVCKELVKFFDSVRPSGRVLKSDPDIDAARAALAKAGAK